MSYVTYTGEVMKNHYDMIVIGAGPAGTPVAIEVAKLDSTKSIALIDSLGELGGECLFQGCIPSKIMEASAKHIKELNSLSSFGIEINSNHYQLVWEKIKQRKDEILYKRSKAAKELAKSVNNIDIIKGFAKFNSKNTIEVLQENQSSFEITFDKAVIATGSKAFVPPYKGDAVDEIITNVEFFAKMELPKSMSIIGGGAIAIEFAQILSAFGVEINLFVRGNTILKNIDKKARDLIFKKLQSDTNINIFTDSVIEAVNHKDSEIEVTYLQNGTKKSLSSQKVLSAAGRVPNISGLNLESAEVKYSKKGITVNSALQTTNKDIFANGDVVENFPKFAHTAQYTSHLLAQNIFLEHNFFKPDFSKNSWVLFSMPNVASAGLTYNKAKKRGIDITVDSFAFDTEAKSQIEMEDYGYLEFVVETKSKRVIGITIVHKEANAIVGEAALIVAKQLTLKELIDTIHPHPTLGESFVLLAKQMMGKTVIEKLDNPVIQTLLKIERWI